jgi:hypothetical protein
LFWRLGPAGFPAAVNGMDIDQLKDGRIRSLYVFLNDQRLRGRRAHGDRLNKPGGKALLFRPLVFLAQRGGGTG